MFGSDRQLGLVCIKPAGNKELRRKCKASSVDTEPCLGLVFVAAV
jgi:hypothetical protein